jgi:hypothetical protein
LEVEGWRFGWGLFAPGDDVFDGVEAGTEGVEAGWKLVEDVCGVGAEQGRVAEHLDGVAEAVEAADDEAFAGDGFSGPEAMGIGCVALAECVGLLPGLLEVAGQHMELPEIAGEGVGIGAEKLGLLENLLGLRQGALQQKGLGPGEGFLRGGGGCAHRPAAG